MIQQDGIAIGEQAVFVVGAALDRHAEHVGILGQGLVNGGRESRLLGFQGGPVGAGRDPPLRGLEPEILALVFGSRDWLGLRLHRPMVRHHRTMLRRRRTVLGCRRTVLRCRGTLPGLLGGPTARILLGLHLGDLFRFAPGCFLLALAPRLLVGLALGLGVRPPPSLDLLTRGFFGPPLGLFLRLPTGVRRGLGLGLGLRFGRDPAARVFVRLPLGVLCRLSPGVLLGFALGLLLGSTPRVLLGLPARLFLGLTLGLLIGLAPGFFFGLALGVFRGFAFGLFVAPALGLRFGLPPGLLFGQAVKGRGLRLVPVFRARPALGVFGLLIGLAPGAGRLAIAEGTDQDLQLADRGDRRGRAARQRGRGGHDLAAQILEVGLDGGQLLGQGRGRQESPIQQVAAGLGRSGGYADGALGEQGGW